MEQATSIHEFLEPVLGCLNHAEVDSSQLDEARERLADVAQSVRDASLYELADFAELLTRLIQVYSPPNGAPISDEHGDIHSFVKNSIGCLSNGLNQDADAQETMSNCVQEAHDRWGDCLELLQSETGEHWEDVPSVEPENASEDGVSSETVATGSQIGLILNSLTTQVAAPPTEDSQPSPNVIESNSNVGPTSTSDEGAILDDPEIREAYMDDAQRCLSSIESSLLAYEEQPSNSQPLQQVCRELHTLKGASASVGLETLAHFLHQVEDDLQAAGDGDTVDLQPIFRAVDAVREQTQRRQPRAKTVGATVATSSPSQESFVDTSPISQDSVRVKSAQLDRLMDMLAELVMLRNRRESRVERLKDVHNELVRCVSRLRAYEENYSSAVVTQSIGEHRDVTPRVSRTGQRVSSLTEIATDLLELGGGLRELYEPVGEENMAISGFIRQFRQELIQLRRVPVRGLFQRLQRSARDAARTEGKLARLQLLGEDVGLESSIQQQLYEPLLHIVRNAVSHGIETEQQRQASGKPAEGTVTLEAHGGANLLVITVRDDGRGLDYDALRRRGLEMGLIPSDRSTSKSDLARLIFHPGFSTRSDTSEISGRGVGMDVVAGAIERMHSWIEVDSVPGQGTSIRLLIPMHSVIEHVMVFRSGGQEFAVPTQFVKFAGATDAVDEVGYPVTNVSRLFGLKSSIGSDPQLIVLAHATKEAGAEHGDQSQLSMDEKSEERLGILVDEIVGPEEVVVRPLPNLLATQRLFSGVTLSGIGDIMLLFDSQKLLERGLDKNSTGHMPGTPRPTPPRPRAKRVLVVDDSRTSRRTLINSLHANRFEIDEAVDGVDALKRLKEQTYDLVFTDLEMPELGGMDLLREIRGNSPTKDLQVVIVSSRGEDCFRQEADRLSVNDYLIKPVTEQVVNRSLDRLETQLEEETT